MVMVKATASVKVMVAIKYNSVSNGQWQQLMAITAATATCSKEAALMTAAATEVTAAATAVLMASTAGG